MAMVLRPLINTQEATLPMSMERKNRRYLQFACVLGLLMLGALISRLRDRTENAIDTGVINGQHGVTHEDSPVNTRDGESGAVRKGPDSHRATITSAGEPNLPLSLDGTIALCMILDGSPAPQADWKCIQDNGKERVIRSTKNGHILLAPGTWTVHSIEKEYSVEPRPVSVAAGRSAVLYVQHAGQLVFQLLDRADKPVAGVAGSWVPASNEIQTWPNAEGEIVQRASSSARPSDANGMIVFVNIPIDCGKAVFAAPEWNRIEYRMCGVVKPVTVIHMEQAAPGSTSVTFVRKPDGTPVADVAASTNDGVLITRTTAGENTMTIPAWVDLHEPLVITSPRTCPATLHLSDLNSYTVELYERAYLDVIIADTDCNDKPCDVALDSGEQVSKTACTPLIPPGYSALPGKSHRVVVPQGAEIGIRGISPCGEVGSVTVVADAELVPVRLSLEHSSDAAHCIVTNERGEPVSGAWARAGYEKGTEAHLASNSNGLISIPRFGELRSMSIGATGYATVCYDCVPSDPVKAKHATSFQVVLSGAVQTEIHVVTADGAPVPRVGLQVWPTRTPTDALRVAAESSAIQCGPSWPPSVTITTDADGIGILRGVPRDVLSANLILEYALSSNDVGQSLYTQEIQLDLRSNPDKLTVVAYAPRSCDISVFEATSGLAVQAFEVSIGNSEDRMSVHGNHWQGWLPQSTCTLHIAVPNVGQAIVELPAGGNDSGRCVYVEPQTTNEIRVEGLPDNAGGSTVVLKVMRREDAGLTMVGTFKSILENGSTRLCLPYQGDIYIGITEIDFQGRAVGITPSWVPWVLGDRIVLEVSVPR